MENEISSKKATDLEEPRIDGSNENNADKDL